VQNFQRDLITDPQGTLMPMVDKLVEQRMSQFIERQQAQAAVAKDFADPQLAPLIEKYRDDYAKALGDGVPYEYSTHMLKMHAHNQAMAAEVAKLKSELAQAGVKVESADERQRLARGEAAITRDPRPPVRDSYELAKAEGKKRGISPDSAQFASLLAKYQK
jgi:signal transduction histidine kinase